MQKSKLDIRKELARNPYVLHEACRNGNSTLVSQLITAGVSVNAQDERGRTPLHEAVDKAQSDIVRFLLDASALLDVKDKEGETALHLASQWNFKAPLVELFLNRGAQIDIQDDNLKTPLHKAIFHGRINVVRLLLARGACVTAQDKAGINAVHRATYEGHLEVLKTIVFYNYPTSVSWSTVEKDSALQDKVLPLTTICLNTIIRRNFDETLLQVLPADLKNKITEHRRLLCIKNLLTIKGRHDTTISHTAARCHNKALINFVEQVLKATTLDELRKLGYKD